MTPAIENGSAFVGSGDHSFYAIDAGTGKKKWSYDMGYAMANNNNTSFPVPPTVVSDGTVYLATGDGLLAIDALTGKGKWLFETWQANYFDRKHAPEGPVSGPVFRRLSKSGRVLPGKLNGWAVWDLVVTSAGAIGIEHLGAHDMRRTCARLCRKKGVSSSRINFCLGTHQSRRRRRISAAGRRSR
jgi:integrase